MWLGCLFASSPNVAEESPDEMALQPGYGYLLIRVICPDGERIARLEMTNSGTGAVITTRFDMYKSAGQKATKWPPLDSHASTILITKSESIRRFAVCGRDCD